MNVSPGDGFAHVLSGEELRLCRSRPPRSPQRYELQDQSHVALRIMSIGATMDGAGRVVLSNRSPSRAGRRYQAAGMVERYHWIILGVNQENRRRRSASRTHRLLDAMVPASYMCVSISPLCFKCCPHFAKKYAKRMSAKTKSATAHPMLSLSNLRFLCLSSRSPICSPVKGMFVRPFLLVSRC